MQLGLRVEGHREMVRALRKAGSEFPRRVRAANKKVADLVVSRAAPAMAGRRGRAYVTARTIKAGATQNSAYVKLGGVPTAMGDEFGSIRYTQFDAWRGSGADAGYALYPTIRQLGRSGELADTYEDEIEPVLREAFPD